MKRTSGATKRGTSKGAKRIQITYERPAERSEALYEAQNIFRKTAERGRRNDDHSEAL